MKIELNKAGYFEIGLRFHFGQLEIAFQCFEENRKKPAGFFHA